MNFIKYGLIFLVAITVVNYVWPILPAPEPSPAAVFGECMGKKNPPDRATCADQRFPKWNLAVEHPWLALFDFDPRQ